MDPRSTAAPKRAGRFLALGAVSVCGLLLAGCAEEPLPGAPELPGEKLFGMLPVVQEHIRTAHQEVLAQPRDAAANGRLAMTLAVYGLRDEALAVFERVRLLEPRNPQWSYFHGHLLGLVGRREEAIDALRRTLQLDRNHADAAVRLAGLLLEDGEVDESRDLYERALGDHPDHLIALYGHGRLLAREGETSKAIEHFRRALAIHEEIGELHYALGNALRRQGDLEAGKRHLELFERYQSNSIEGLEAATVTINQLHAGDRPHLLKAKLLYENERYAESIIELARALEVNPNNAVAHMHLVRLYGGAGDHEKAELHYRRALELEPRSPQLHHYWGSLERRRGRFQEARESLERSLELDPANAKAHAELGFVLSNLGEADEAIASYERCLEIEPYNQDSRFLLGKALAEQNRYREAAEQIERATTPLGPKTAAFLRVLATVYLEMNDAEAAKRSLRRAQGLVGAQPESAIARAVRDDLARLERKPSSASGATPSVQ